MAEYDKEATEVPSGYKGPEPELKEPKKSYVPEGFDSVEDYLEDMRKNYELDVQYDDDNRCAALQDKAFVAGEQWDPEVLEQRKGLPCLSLNTIPQFIGQLVGDWRTNRIGIKVLPSENGDREVASVRGDLIRSIQTSSRADRIYNDAFESMVQCGDGAFRVAVQYAGEDVFDQDIVLKPIADCLAVVWDRLSVDPTGRDAVRVFVDDLMPKKDFNERWPDHDPSTLSDKHQSTLRKEGWCETGAVRVTEHWRIIERKKTLVMFQDGSTHKIDPDTDLEALVQEHGLPEKRRDNVPCRYAQMHLVTGHAILAGPYEYKLDRLPIIRMAGRTVRISDRNVRYGLVRFMKDAVRLRNFWRSIAAEQLGYAPKAQWIATESAVEGREDAIRKAHQTRDPLLIVNDEAQIDVTIKRIDPPALQMALLNEAQVNTQDMKDITGIHDASLGIKSNETSGRAIMARQREGDIGALTYYDNGNAAVLEAGDVINQLIGQIYDGTRIIRVIGEDEAAKLVKINDPYDPASPDLSVGKYDVAITTGANFTTRRVEAAQAMMEAIQVAPEIMQVAGDLVVKAQDWPGAEELSDRLKKTIPPQLLSEEERAEMEQNGGPNVQQLMEQQAQMQEMMQQGQEMLQKLEAENAVLKAKHDVDMRKAEIDEFKAETERMKVIGELAAKDEEFNIRQLEAEAQMENNEAERATKVELADKAVKAKPSTGKPQPKPSE